MHDLSDVLKVYNINNSITKCWPLNSFADFNTIANTSTYMFLSYVNLPDANGNPDIFSGIHTIFVFYNQGLNLYRGYNNGGYDYDTHQSIPETYHFLWQLLSGKLYYTEAISKNLFISGCIIKE
jgi:hypothetical protein